MSEIVKNKDVDEFFRAHLYKQMVDSNAGNSQVMQALFGKMGEKIISDGDMSDVISSMSELNNLNKAMQTNTIDLMKQMKQINE